MYDPTSFTPFFRPALYAIYMGAESVMPLYIVVLKIFVKSASGDSSKQSIYESLIISILKNPMSPLMSPIPHIL